MRCNHCALMHVWMYLVKHKWRVLSFFFFILAECIFSIGSSTHCDFQRNKLLLSFTLGKGNIQGGMNYKIIGFLQLNSLNTFSVPSKKFSNFSPVVLVSYLSYDCIPLMMAMGWLIFNRIMSASAPPVILWSVSFPVFIYTCLFCNPLEGIRQWQ